MMTKLERTVLSFLSLATADGLNTEAETVDLETMLSDITAGLATLVTSTGAVVRSDLQVRHVTSQPSRIRQIIENLVANGLKYSDPAKAEQVVTVSSRPEPDGFRIAVEDNGCGIAEKNIDKVFDLFARFHSASEGNGLGLAIVKRHVEALSGRIRVENTGDGTRFTVTIPATPMEAAV